MKRTKIVIYPASAGWEVEKVKKEKKIQERVPKSTCVMEENDDPEGWRLTITREYPDP